MSALLDWLANNESALSAVAAIIAIIAGIAVSFRLILSRVPGDAQRPKFLSQKRNIALISFGLIALALVLILATNKPTPSGQTAVARLTKLTGKPSVAVLPLNYFSDDQTKSYLAEGIADELIWLRERMGEDSTS